MSPRIFAHHTRYVGVLLVFAAVAGACDGSAQPSAAKLESTGDRCFSCHQPDYRQAHPTHVNVKPATCAVCHTQESWHPTVLKHDAFPLTGKHAKVKCLDCHNATPAVFAGTSNACLSCHAKDLARENAKDTWHAHFATTCENCHQTTGWKPAKSEPGFELHAADTPTVQPTAKANTTTKAAATAKPAAPKPKVPAAPQPVPIPKTAPTPPPSPPDPLTGASTRTKR